MRPLQARERRVLALGSAAALVLLLASFVVIPLVAGFGERAVEREVLEREAAAGRRLLDGLPALREAARRQAETAGSFALAGSDGGAALETLVQASLTAAGITPEEAAAEAPAEDAARVRVRVHLPLEQLYGWLRGLAAEAPFVRVDQIDIEGEGDAAALNLRVRLSVPADGKGGGDATGSALGGG